MGGMDLYVLTYQTQTVMMATNADAYTRYNWFGASLTADDI